MRHARWSALVALLASLGASSAGCGGGSGSGAKSGNTQDTPAKDAGTHPTSKPQHHYPAVDHDASTADRPGSGAVGSADAAVDGGARTHEAATDMDAAQAMDAAPFMPTCSPITLKFKGTVATVADKPLGLDDSVRTSDVSGTFAYLPCLPDQEPDPKRGIYEHPSGGAFSLSVGGRSITGSGQPRLEVENLDPDTIRWRDGKIPLDTRERVMFVDDKPAADLEVLIAITDGSGGALSNDAPPTRFPYLDIASFPHTFSVSDSNGTLLLQLSAMTQM